MEKYRRQRDSLVELLRGQAREFPRFRNELTACAERIVAQSQRTRESDRQKVIKALKEWPEGLGRLEIMEDTGLSEWDVRQILAGLVKSGKVREKPEPRPCINPSRWRILYALKG